MIDYRNCHSDEQVYLARRAAAHSAGFVLNIFMSSCDSQHRTPPNHVFSWMAHRRNSIIHVDTFIKNSTLLQWQVLSEYVQWLRCNPLINVLPLKDHTVLCAALQKGYRCQRSASSSCCLSLYCTLLISRFWSLIAYGSLLVEHVFSLWRLLHLKQPSQSIVFYWKGTLVLPPKATGKATTHVVLSCLTLRYNTPLS